jgi:GNAT superfamily N-acetyltransferase
MDPGFIGVIAIPIPPAGAGAVRAGARTALLHLRETATTSCADRIEVVLYAYLENEMVAALDFTRMDDGVCVNTVFVKPQFRRRGIGSALVRHIATAAKISWAGRKCDALDAASSGLRAAEGRPSRP